MELKLKDGWLDYFMSGFLIGAVAVIVSFLEYFKAEVTPPSIDVLGLFVIILLLSVFSFIMGCRVKRGSVKP